MACSWLLNKLPEITEGVLRAQADIQNSSIRVNFDENQTNLEEIARSINSLGYYPRLVRSSDKIYFRKQEERSLLLRLGVAGISAGNTMMIAVSLYQGYFTGIEEKYRLFFHIVSLLLSLPAMIYSAQPFYRASLGSVSSGNLHLDLPISIGIILAFIASTFSTFAGYQHVYFDSICILIFLLLIGRYIQLRSVNSVFEGFDKAYSVVEPFATLVRPDGKSEKKYILCISSGDTIQVEPETRIPVDGELITPNTQLDLSILTGETHPQAVIAGEKVYSGAKNIGESILIKAKTNYQDSRLGKLIEGLQNQEFIELNENSSGSLGYYFVLTVILISIANFICWFYFTGFIQAFEHTLALIVVTCPCALGIAKPLSLTLASSSARKNQILLRSPDLLDKLAKIKLIFFDKTGTLTDSNPSVNSVFQIDDELLTLTDLTQLEARIGQEKLSAVIKAERSSNHPLAKALVSYLSSTKLELTSTKKTFLEKEIAGRGIEIKFQNGELIQIGSISWLLGGKPELKNQILEEVDSKVASPVILGINGKPSFVFFIGAKLKEDAAETIQQLREDSIEPRIVSGDLKEIVEKTATLLSIPKGLAFSEKSPNEKANIIETQKSSSVSVAMVGDGVNDSLALKSADLGFSISGGVELSFSSSDIYLSSGELKSIVKAIRLGKETSKLITKALGFSLAYNISFAGLACAGLINPLLAAVLMPASSLSLIGYVKLFKPNVT